MSRWSNSLKRGSKTSSMVQIASRPQRRGPGPGAARSKRSTSRWVSTTRSSSAKLPTTKRRPRGGCMPDRKAIFAPRACVLSTRRSTRRSSRRYLERAMTGRPPQRARPSRPSFHAVLSIGNTVGCRRPGAADETRQHQDRDDVRQRLDELIGDAARHDPQAEGFEEAEEHGGAEGAGRPPVAEDDRRERDEAQTLRHAFEVGVRLLQYQVRARQ